MGVKRAKKEKKRRKDSRVRSMLFSVEPFNIALDINSAICSPGGLSRGFAKLHQ
jgi:hypothetical protein